MAEFAVHIRASEETDPERAEQLLEPYVSEHEEVSYGEESIQDTGGTGFVPEQSCLLVDGVELLADIYTDLQSHPDVAKVILGGPGSERFPVPVQHYALQQLEYPDLYEYHALDGKVTLVIAESQMEAEKVREDVPAAALGFSHSPF